MVCDRWLRVYADEARESGISLFSPPSLIFGEIEEHDYDAVEFCDFLRAQVVLGHGDIGFAHGVSVPTRQAHVGRAGVRALGDQFRRGLAGGGEVKLVLDGLKDELRFGFRGRVVGSERQDFAYA